jgi:DNA primase
MDAIAAHQAGSKNVVASMGTALTGPQVDAIRRLTNRVIMALDQDPAGQQATLRSLESSWHIYQSRVAGQSRGTTLLQRADIPEIRIAAMPEGQDPDEVIHRSPAEWGRLLDEARPLIEYVVTAAASHLDASTPQGKTQIVEAVFPLIAAVNNAAQQDHYFQLLADRLNISMETLRASVARPAAPRRPGARQPAQQPPVAASPFAKLNHDPVEEYCLALLMRYPDLGEQAEGLRPEVFLRHENREIVSRFLDAGTEEGLAQGPPSFPASMKESAVPEVLDQLEALERKTLPPLDLTKRRRAFSEVMARLEERDLRRLKAEEEIRFSESPPDLESDEHQNTLDINQRIKINETLRRSPIRSS